MISKFCVKVAYYYNLTTHTSGNYESRLNCLLIGDEKKKVNIKIFWFMVIINLIKLLLFYLLIFFWCEAEWA